MTTSHQKPNQQKSVVADAQQGLSLALATKPQGETKMALWGKTDALASAPKFIARRAFFDSTAVNTTAETINIIGSNTGFATGDEVVYGINGGTVIGGLTDAATYYVRVVGAGLIELYDTYARAINTGATTGRLNITGAGVGTHILQRTTAANASAGQPGIFFVDAQEAQVTANKAKGITGAGWWAYRTYTDAQSATRHKAECLIAIAVGAVAAGDAEDTVVVDLVITIGTQPASEEITSGDDVTLTVAATINGAVPLTYQWFDASDDSEVEGATGTDLELTDVTEAASYYVIVSGAGVTATSDTADITIAE